MKDFQLEKVLVEQLRQLNSKEKENMNMLELLKKKSRQFLLNIVIGDHKNVLPK